jgi:hypothetical protein
MVMLLRESGRYGIIFMNVCFVITIAMAMLLRDYEPYGMISMIVCCYNRRHGKAIEGFSTLHTLYVGW